MTDNQSILVTGGAGYLGAVMVPELLRAGHKVTVLDNFMFRQNSLAAVCAEPRFTVVKADARDTRVLDPLLAEADVVIPLAALVGAPICDMDEIGAVSINRDAVLSILSRLSPRQRVLMPITNSGYGIGSNTICTEETPMRPISLYGRTKVEAEDAVLDRGNSISFRLATVFGMSPRMRVDLLVNDFVYRALNDRSVVLFEGHFKRNYIHVRDVARTFLHGLDVFDDIRDNAYNVGLSDANLSKVELCERIRGHLPNFAYLEAEIGEDPDKRDYIVSNAKLEATGWQPTHSLDDGIKELIKGFTMVRNTVHGNV
jgi:nucleoside-diphosphate-sugar epimerase